MYKKIDWWNSVRYCDCLDPDLGLPSLPDKSVDLCLTDPPYNKKFRGFNGFGNYKQDIVYYDDNMTIEEYAIWCKKWFKELKRICENIIISVGINNQKLWFHLDNVDDIYYNVDKSGKFGSKIATFNKIEPWFYFGKTSQQFDCNVCFYNRGFEKHTWLHPCPRNYDVVEYLIKGLAPQSVVDPFMGSGTTAEVCTKLEIPWLGYEINEVYKQDIDKRLEYARKYKKKIPKDVITL